MTTSIHSIYHCQISLEGLIDLGENIFDTFNKVCLVDVGLNLY